MYLPIEKQVNSGFERYSNFDSPCFGQQSNTHLSGPQKELLLWHRKLGISMLRIQEMMGEQKSKEPSIETLLIPPIIKPKFASTPNCVVSLCALYKLARTSKKSPGVIKHKLFVEKEDILSCNKYEYGYFFSTDQLVVGTPGQLDSGYGLVIGHTRIFGGHGDVGTSVVTGHMYL